MQGATRYGKEIPDLHRYLIDFARAHGGGGGGITYTAATVTSGQSYNVKTSDLVIRMDTSGGEAATGVLPAPTFIGEKHIFFWFAWGVGQVLPVVNTSGGKLLVPFTGMSASGNAGLEESSTIATTGACYPLTWDGTEWTNA